MRRQSKVAARPRLRQREFAPPLLVGVADADVEGDEEDPTDEAALRHLKVVPTAEPLNESVS
jgi:hypothetical protein